MPIKPKPQDPSIRAEADNILQPLVMNVDLKSDFLDPKNTILQAKAAALYEVRHRKEAVAKDHQRWKKNFEDFQKFQPEVRKQFTEVSKMPEDKLADAFGQIALNRLSEGMNLSIDRGAVTSTLKSFENFFTLHKTDSKGKVENDSLQSLLENSLKDFNSKQQELYKKYQANLTKHPKNREKLHKKYQQDLQQLRFQAKEQFNDAVIQKRNQFRYEMSETLVQTGKTKSFWPVLDRIENDLDGVEKTLTRELNTLLESSTAIDPKTESKKLYDQAKPAMEMVFNHERALNEIQQSHKEQTQTIVDEFNAQWQKARPQIDKLLKENPSNLEDELYHFYKKISDQTLESLKNKDDEHFYQVSQQIEKDIENLLKQQRQQQQQKLLSGNKKLNPEGKSALDDNSSVTLSEDPNLIRSKNNKKLTPDKDYNLGNGISMRQNKNGSVTFEANLEALKTGAQMAGEFKTTLLFTGPLTPIIRLFGDVVNNMAKSAGNRQKEKAFIHELKTLSEFSEGPILISHPNKAVERNFIRQAEAAGIPLVPYRSSQQILQDNSRAARKPKHPGPDDYHQQRSASLKRTRLEHDKEEPDHRISNNPGR